MTASGITAAVVIVTFDRPDYLATCLEHLARQTRPPDEIVVVDSSGDDQTEALLLSYPKVRYVRNPSGYGHMTQSRNLGYRETTADIVAYVDDDAFADQRWLEALLSPFADRSVGAVGGRAINNEPDEHRVGVDAIGKLLPNGHLTGNFAADPGRVVDSDHIIGCNMSFRRTVLDELEGFHEDFPGTALREDTDMSLRVGRAGHRVVFQPAAIVEHVGAPHARGRRFDVRYTFYSHRNHAAMLVRNFGRGPLLYSYLSTSTRDETAAALRRVASGLLRLGVFAVGTADGVVAGLRQRRADAMRAKTSMVSRGANEAARSNEA